MPILSFISITVFGIMKGFWFDGWWWRGGAVVGGLGFDGGWWRGGAVMRTTNLIIFGFLGVIWQHIPTQGLAVLRTALINTN